MFESFRSSRSGSVAINVLVNYKNHIITMRENCVQSHCALFDLQAKTKGRW